MNFEEIKKIKGELSFTEVFKNDSSNISNHFNTHRYRQLIEGNIKSPSLEMLLNFGKFNLSDFKTLDYFNKQGLAIKELAIGSFGEVNSDNNIALDKNVKLRSNFDKILNHRKSYRDYINKPLSLNLFKRSLKPLVNTKNKENIIGLNINHRAYASGGGLYPITAFLLVLNVNNVQRGWYEVQPYLKNLRYLNKLDVDVNTLISGHNIDVSHASYIIFYCFNFSKSYPKYGETATALGLIEIGEMAELVDLTVTSLGLGNCQVAGFDRNLIAKKLNIDNVSNHLLHSQIVGVI
ncbi:SagB/ThcOx family dehydrogenase [Limosilactobacillus allomucosae]|uniref:SagB/ThcOx family dehydrogenase n=1 Tax=Limosilactobacillus allomucosae TaxID=3142938 RepID=A0ABV0I4Z8_9LACO